MSDQKIYAFVYGTLKRGFGNGERCLANSKFIGEAMSVAPDFKLYASGIPFLVYAPNGPGAKVKGELFEVSPSDFRRCDNLEGHPRMYKREQHEFTVIGESESIMAWVYLWPAERTGRDRAIKPVNGVIEWQPQRDPQR